MRRLKEYFFKKIKYRKKDIFCKEEVMTKLKSKINNEARKAEYADMRREKNSTNECHEYSDF